MEWHPYAELFPMLGDAELQSLADDIAEHGLREQIVIYENKILDGRNRWKACELAGVEPETWHFDDDDEAALAYVVSCNVKRRSISKSQAAAVAVEAEELIERLKGEAEKRAGGRPSLTKPPQKIGEVCDKHASETVHHLAGLFNTNRQYVADAMKLKQESPELFEQVKSGDLGMPQAKREFKKRQVLADLQEVESLPVEQHDGKYDVLVIDPPWPMAKIERDVTPDQVAFEYPTMTEDELSVLDIPASDDCHVWLWTTHKFLPMALRLLQRWELKYVCNFVWHKPGGFQPFGLPQYNCEFALYARRGSPIFADVKAFPVCFDAPRGKHSEKPEAFYELVRRVTAGRRLDMFNRRHIDGFDGWGKESPDG